jgi:hypothetical protein
VLYHHADITAAAQIYGLIDSPDMEITDEEFGAADGLVRLIGGNIIMGKTEAEKQAERNAERVFYLKRRLVETDYIAAKIAEWSATVEEYAEQIAERQAWRTEIQQLS